MMLRTTRLIQVLGLLVTTTVDLGAFRNPAQAESGLTMLGADVSTLQQAEDLGAKFYYADGRPGEALQILKDNGVNTIRLRIWVAPHNGYNNKAKVLEFARKIKAKGLQLMVDFHYSDTWADPAKQFKPAAWASHDIHQLARDVYDYTFDVCSSLKAQGTPPDSVQVGNEILPGMLWPEGKVVDGNYTNLSLLIKAGYRATKTCNDSTQVVIHVDNAGNTERARTFYDGIKAEGVEWDITGLSYYSYWHSTMDAMAWTVAEMKARYGKPVIVAETAYPFTLESSDAEPNVINSTAQLTAGYPATMEGQYNNLRDVMATAERAGAIGVFYWEPTWISVKGNGWDPDNPASGNNWENQALFNFKGVANPALKAFKRE